MTMTKENGLLSGTRHGSCRGRRRAGRFDPKPSDNVSAAQDISSKGKGHAKGHAKGHKRISRRLA